MTQTIGPLGEALTHGGRQVVSTVYQELQALFTRIGQWADPGAPGEQGSAHPHTHDEHVLAGPLSALASLLTREQDVVESVRKGRAEAVLAYLRLRPRLRGQPETLGAMVRGWRQSERSEGVQRILDEALARV